MKQILITTSSFGKGNPSVLQALSDNGFEYILNPYKRKLSEDEITGLIEQYQPIGIIAGVEPITRSVLNTAKKLKVISRAGIGMDAIDLQAARERGIVVTNTPDAPTIPVAELTMSLILSLLRRISLSDASIRRGEWVRPMGNLLHGKTVGIVGCGRIGKYLARLCSSFGCRILGYDPFIDSPGSFQPVSLDQLLSEADIISLHIPYTPENHHFINIEKIQRMKQGALLINAARGGLVDEDALYNSLNNGHLGGAALDCFEKEPYAGALIKLDNVMLTAHIGSYAQEGRNIMEKQSVENLLCELKKAD